MKPTGAMVALAGVDVRLGGRVVLKDLRWRLAEGEHWGVLGANGAGKSVFLSLVRGDIWPAASSPGRRLYGLNGAATPSPLEFRRRSALVSPGILNTYHDRQWHHPALEVVAGGIEDSVYVRPERYHEAVELARQVMDRLGIDSLAGRDILSLSRGEAIKVLLARALVKSPAILLVDEICSGLDSRGRQQVLQLLEEEMHRGTQLVYATPRPGELPPGINRVVVLEGGRIRWSGEGAALPPVSKNRLWRGLSWRRDNCGGRTPVFQLQGAAVVLGGRQVLAPLEWTVAAGEKWLVSGANGAGKSTLLRLLMGEAHPFSGGRVWRFGRTGGDIWRVRRRLGYVSASLQTALVPEQTVFEAVASGFFASNGIYRPLSVAQRQRTAVVLEGIGLEALGERPVGSLSSGQMRQVLLGRALVHGPEVLLLDEPTEMLDGGASAAFHHALERLLAEQCTVIWATCDPGTAPSWCTHALELERGRVIYAGPRKEESTGAGWREVWREAAASDRSRKMG